MSQTIFVLEDDENIRELVSVSLSSAGFSVFGFGAPEQFYKAVAKQTPHLIVLDIMLPEQSGYEVLQYLKRMDATKKIPIIFLTAKSTELDKVQGLNMGADDYIAKPFGVLELIARVSAVIRRCGLDETRENCISYKDLLIYVDQKAIYKGQEQIALTYKEYALFSYLYKNKGIVLSREKLLEHVWGFDFDGETRTVDAHVRSLRMKLGDNIENPVYIATVRGHGYMMLH